MQENRSFDQYFGTMKGVRGFGDPRPVLQDNGKSVFYQSNGTKDVLPFNPQVADLGMQFRRRPQPRLGGRPPGLQQRQVRQVGPGQDRDDDGVHDGNDIPFHYALADAFTVCDAYHCSFIGATDPNRYYMWSGYTGNDGVGRPGPRQPGGGLRLEDVPRAAGGGRGLLEDLPGHRRRPERGRLLGLDQRRLPRQLR
ncbi:alkaline phosphatase family protein [Streptomyces cirratus]